MQIYSVSIIGLGNIGMMYDYNSDSDYTSHTKSFFSHEAFEIKYLIDTNQKQIDLARQKYKSGTIEFLNCIEDIQEITDIFVLACHPDINKSLIKKLAVHKEIKLFVVEKPFLSNLNDFDNLSGLNSRILINYPRKFMPSFRNIKDQIHSYEWGKCLGIHMWYSKGLRNNGSHLIDLLLYLFGKQQFSNIQVFSKIFDFQKDDPSIGCIFQIYYNNQEVSVVLQPANELIYSIIEIDLIFENKRYRITDFGDKVDIYEKEDDKLFSGYKNIKFKQTQDLKLNYYALNTCDYIYELLENKVNNYSDLQNEKSIIENINNIKQLGNE